MRIPFIKTVSHSQEKYTLALNILNVRPHLNQQMKNKMQRHKVEWICVSPGPVIATSLRAPLTRLCTTARVGCALFLYLPPLSFPKPLAHRGTI